MEGQELYDHLNELREMIEKNKIMFEHEDMEEIVSEVIDETLEEYFDWEENGEVVYRGSNPRIVVGRVSATAMEGDDEEKVEDPGQQDRSQNSGMAGQEQITLDQEEGHVTVIDASENGTAERHPRKIISRGLCSRYIEMVVMNPQQVYLLTLISKTKQDLPLASDYCNFAGIWLYLQIHEDSWL